MPIFLARGIVLMDVALMDDVDQTLCQVLLDGVLVVSVTHALLAFPLPKWQLGQHGETHVVLKARYDGRVHHAVLHLILSLATDEVVLFAQAHGRGHIKPPIWQVLEKVLSR